MATVMDLVCSQYGWTIQQVFEHTRQQVMELVDEIVRRKNEDIKFQASIHGAKLKNNSGGNKTLDLGEDIDKLSSIGIDVVKG
jgi:hypothetical protein